MGNEILNEILDIKTKIQDTLEGIPNSNNIFGHINRTTLESRLKRLESIEKILKQEKYNITFIGTVGAGKTTVISHLFNLVDEVEKTIRKKGRERKVTAIEPLLSTGSGRTTICEVIIQPSQEISIEIDPYTKEELTKEIEYFCESFYKDNEDDEDKLKGSSISEELERALRSIIGLKKNVSNPENPDKKIDQAKEKAKKISKDKFREYAIQKANLNSRVYAREESRLECDSENIKAWIKENFSKVNKGEISTFSIPKKIYLNITQEIFGQSYADLIDHIVDTKGIDENPIREDLVNQIDDENTIVLFTSSYNDAPESDVRELIEHTLSKKSKNYQDRFILLVMPRNNEPENENDGDGSWENGIELKKEIVKKVFKEKNLNFIDENILFYDALKCFDSEGRIDRDYEEEDIQEEKNELIESINAVIENRKDKLEQEVKKIRESCYSIQSGDIELTQEGLEKIKTLEKNLKDIKDLSRRVPNYVYEEFIDGYVNYYSTRYKAWNTKDAIHRRYGIFSERGYSTYYDAKIIAEGLTQDEMLYKITKDLKNEITNSIIELGSSVDELKTITPEIIKLFEIEYDNFIDSVGSGVMNFLQEENKNVEFWSQLIERRGKGKGYNVDVARMLKNKLKTLKNGLSIDGVFQFYVEKEWEILIDKILIFFIKNGTKIDENS